MRLIALEESLCLVKSKPQHFRSLSAREPAFAVALYDEHFTRASCRICGIQTERTLPAIRNIENQSHVGRLLRAAKMARGHFTHINSKDHIGKRATLNFEIQDKRSASASPREDVGGEALGFESADDEEAAGVFFDGGFVDAGGDEQIG
jgi:hypothetical protein